MGFVKGYEPTTEVEFRVLLAPVVRVRELPKDLQSRSATVAIVSTFFLTGPEEFLMYTVESAGLLGVYVAGHHEERVVIET